MIVNKKGIRVMGEKQQKTKNFFKRWVFGGVELGQPNALKGGLNEFFVFVLLPLHFLFV